MDKVLTNASEYYTRKECHYFVTATEIFSLSVVNKLINFSYAGAVSCFNLLDVPK